jgi:gamma-glutamyltranspeptidase / glutathione hydrolase
VMRYSGTVAITALAVHFTILGQEEGGGGRWQARSMVETKFGIVATSQTLASAAGAHILEMGGNAIDAAIAANAVLGVVEPMSDGIGGDLFAIYYEAKTGKLYGLNSSGWAPTGLTIEAIERCLDRRQMGALGFSSARLPNGRQAVSISLMQTLLTPTCLGRRLRDRLECRAQG